MSTISTDPMKSRLKLIAILMAAAMATGCISAKSKPTAEAEPAAAPPVPVEPEPPAPEPTPEPIAQPEKEVLTEWTVVRGNNLWSISSHEEVYDLPEQWPLIYKANLDQINDADLIYPGQVLTIPRKMSQQDIDGAIAHARNRGAWSLGPIEASDLEYIKHSSL